MSTLVSDKEQLGSGFASKKLPLSGEKLDAAINAMETPGFLARLTARIIKIWRQVGRRFSVRYFSKGT
jgi:hypothetical protein